MLVRLTLTLTLTMTHNELLVLVVDGCWTLTTEIDNCGLSSVILLAKVLVEYKINVVWKCESVGLLSDAALRADLEALALFTFVHRHVRKRWLAGAGRRPATARL